MALSSPVFFVIEVCICIANTARKLAEYIRGPVSPICFKLILQRSPKRACIYIYIVYVLYTCLHCNAKNWSRNFITSVSIVDDSFCLRTNDYPLV